MFSSKVQSVKTVIWYLFICYLLLFFISPIYNAYCLENYANDACDGGCNTAECLHDGLDCSENSPKFAKGVLIIIVLVPEEEMRLDNVSKTFLREIGHILRTVVVFVKDEYGKNRIEAWSSNGKDDIGIFYRFKRDVYMSVSEGGKPILTRHRRAGMITG